MRTKNSQLKMKVRNSRDIKLPILFRVLQILIILTLLVFI